MDTKGIENWSRTIAFWSTMLCLIALAGCSSGGSSPAHAQATTFCVNPTGSSGCFSTISAAVAAAPSGQLITVQAGTYKEMVTINKPLDLEGSVDSAGRVDLSAPSIIDASGLSHGVYIVGVTTGAVEVEGFEVENANREGILAENSTQVPIRRNFVEDSDQSLDTSLFQQGQCPTTTPPTICCKGAFPFDQDDCGEAIHLRGVEYSSVLGNHVVGNHGGILLTDETGPTAYNVVAHNISEHNTIDCGITLPSHPLCGAGSNDTAGCIGGPEIGKPANGVFSNIVTANLSQDNGAAGVGDFAPTPGTASYSNTITGNILLDNGQGGVVLHSHAAGQDLNNVVITDNIISNNGADPGVTTAPVGIVVFANGTASPPATALSGINIAHNTINEDGIDVFVGTGLATNVTLSLNNLLGTNDVLGVDNAGTGNVAAMANYWGCSEGPGADPACTSIMGNVFIQPPLVNPVTIPDPTPGIPQSTSGS